MPKAVFFLYLIAFSCMGWVKLGQPVPDLNFIVESKNRVLEQTQLYFYESWVLHKAP